MKIKLIYILLILLVAGCVSAPPNLTKKQRLEASKIKVYKAGENTPESYQVIGKVKVADCSSQENRFIRISGEESKAIEGLMSKAYLQGANAIINVECSYIPLINNCWAANQCIGIAIKLPE